MDWAKTKVILIFVFLALNIFLITNLILQGSKSVSISQQDILDIQTILSQNNIDLKCTLPSKVRPKPFLKVEDLGYNEQELVKKFLGEGSTSIKSNNSVLYKNGSKSIEILNDKAIIYKDSQPNDSGIGTSKSRVINYVENYLKQREFYPKHGVVSEYITKPDGYEIRYKQEYKKSEIFASYISIKLTNTGITEIKGRWVTPIEFMDTPKDIKTPVEILFTFIKDLEFKERVSIERVALGYYFPSEDFKNASVSAIPVWAIETSDKKVYYYNAYEGYLEGKFDK